MKQVTSPLCLPPSNSSSSFLRTPACVWGQRFKESLSSWLFKLALCKRGALSSWAFVFPHPLSPHTPPRRNHHISLLSISHPTQKYFLKNMGRTFRGDLVQVFHLQSRQSRPKEVMVSKLAQGQGLTLVGKTKNRTGKSLETLLLFLHCLFHRGKES